MIELLDSINHWHWLAFGLALLALDLLGTAGYFLWLGLSALIVGALFTFIPMSWQLQWVSFAVFSLATTWLWWRKQFKKDKQGDAKRDLNQKHKQLIGQTLVLDENFPAGKGRVKLGDTTWAAQSSQDLRAGSIVEVQEVNGIVLTISEKV
ncbi:hypothetical protein AKJ18_21410 [Vibrio xuii]|nr:hypothetical protein AKJ18_21410 [Vibrio xuii]